MALDGIISPLDGFGSPFGTTGRPGWLDAGLWGFTASPTPQYAHFGRSTNKAGALASTRNYEAYNLAGTQLFPVNDPVVSAVTGLEGWGSYQNIATWSAADTRWQPNGTTPPDVALEQTHLGLSCAAVTFAALTPGGYSSSRADRNGVNLARHSVTSGMTYIMSFDISFSRALTGSEQIQVYQTGVIGLNSVFFTSSNTPSLVGAWTRVTSQTSVSSLSGTNFPVILPFNYVGASPVTVYIRNIQVQAALFASPYTPTTSAAATRLADNTTIPQWQSFVERYSLLDGLTIDATANIRLTPSAARRILTIGTANDGFFLEQTTSNTISAVLRASSADVWTMTSGAIGAAGNRRVQVTLKPGANALTVEGVTGASNSNATALPDAIRTEPAYVGRDIAGSLHWNGNIPSLKIGKAG